MIREFFVKRKETIPSIFLVIITSIPILYGFYYVFIYGVNVPIWDQWSTIVTWTLSYYEGNFDINSLMEEQNDSRIPIPGLLILFFSILTKMDIKLLYYIGYILYVFAFLLVFIEIKKFNGNTLKDNILLIPLVFYWFNPYYLSRFVDNIGGFTYSFIILFVILTIFFLDRSKESKFFYAISILTAIICSFSGVWGLFIWIAGSFQIFLQKSHNKIQKMFFWNICMISIVYLYYFALEIQKSGIHGIEGYKSYIQTAMIYPFNKFLCFLGAIGAQVIHNNKIALFFGLLIMIIFLILIINNRHFLMLDSNSKWYALIFFWGITSLSLALTRSGSIGYSTFGPPDTIFFIPSVRHSPIIFFPIIGVYILTLIYRKDSINRTISKKDKINLKNIFYNRKAINRFLLFMIFILLICGTAFHFLPGISLGNSYKDRAINSQYLLLHYNNVDDEDLKILHFNPSSIRDKIKAIQSYKLSLFSEFERKTNNTLPYYEETKEFVNLPKNPSTQTTILTL